MREPAGEVPPLGRMQQVQTKVAHLAKVTGRSDRKTFLDFNVLFCVNLPACFCIRHFPFFFLLHEDQR